MIEIKAQKIKRPILIATIGYIIGIIIGLYLKNSIAFLYIPIIIVAIHKKSPRRKHPQLDKKGQKRNDPKCPNRYFRYVKLILNSKVILVIIVSSIISNSIVIFQNEKYSSLYKDISDISGRGVVISNIEEKEYKNQVKIKVLDINGEAKFKDTCLYLRVDKKSTEGLKYGDEVTFFGEFQEPSISRNFGGFDYKEYLKTEKVYGSVSTNSVKVLQHNKVNVIFSFSNKCLCKFEETIDFVLDNEKAELLKGILLGDNSGIDEDLKNDFRISSISHILAVSGMHVAYIVIGMNLLLKSKISKNKTKIIIIIFLVFYMFITGFSPSVVRACVMQILILIAGLVHRKNDTMNSLSLSLILILIYNPFLIMNIGLQFSYIGTIGILFLNNNVLKFLKGIKIKNKKWKYKIHSNVTKISDKMKEILAITISAQLAILPVMIYHFNVFGVYFFITNLLVSVIIGPIIILGIVTIFSYITITPIAKILAVILSFLIQILIFISRIGELPYSKIYIRTPQIYEIIIYYLVLIILNFCYKIYSNSQINTTRKKSKKLNCTIQI